MNMYKAYQNALKILPIAEQTNHENNQKCLKLKEEISKNCNLIDDAMLESNKVEEQIVVLRNQHPKDYEKCKTIRAMMKEHSWIIRTDLGTLLKATRKGITVFGTLRAIRKGIFQFFCSPTTSKVDWILDPIKVVINSILQDIRQNKEII